jgi:hypothetical protein
MPAHLRFFSPALAVVALGLADRVCAQSSDSPFMPRSGPVASAGPNENLEFAGVNVMATTTYASVYDKQTKKSRWIAVGSSDGTISVLAYDPRREQIVVKSGDIQKTLTLRKANGPTNAPAPVAVMPAAAGFNVAPPEAPSVPQTLNAGAPTDATAQTGPAAPPHDTGAAKPEPPAKPNAVARQEEEARMLVSDLLEIGMAQRKAYEEAQKKAAATETEKASTTPAPAPGT